MSQYRVSCVYLPNANVHAVGRPGRGAWRVVSCWPAFIPQLRDVYAHNGHLYIVSHRKRTVNSWCSPRKILAELQRERRLRRAADEFVHGMINRYTTKETA